MTIKITEEVLIEAIEDKINTTKKIIRNECLHQIESLAMCCNKKIFCQ